MKNWSLYNLLVLETFNICDVIPDRKQKNMTLTNSFVWIHLGIFQLPPGLDPQLSFDHVDLLTVVLTFMDMLG